MRKKSVKGLSLIEMVVVLAIIGILVMILVPSIFNYYRGARMKTQNTNARIVFNAAQTISQRYEMQARSVGAPVLEGAETENGLVLVCENGTLLSTNPTNAAKNTVYQQFCDRVNSIYADGETTCWAVYVSKYIVQVSLCAENSDDLYVGRYPQPMSADDRGTVSLNKDTNLVSMKDQAEEYWGTPTTT